MALSVLLLHLVEALRVGVGAYKVSLHVEDAPLCIHKVLVRFTFNLNLLHDDTVDHVDRLAFFFLIDELIAELLVDRLTVLVDELLLLLYTAVVGLVVQVIVLEFWVFARSLDNLLLVIYVELVDLVVVDRDRVEEAASTEATA